jgi:hypothetical protein
MLWRMMQRRRMMLWRRRILRRRRSILEETLEKENVVESDTEEVVQEVEDFENEGYFEEENVVENDAEKEAAKCHICGMEDESGHHAVVPCTKA